MDSQRHFSPSQWGRQGGVALSMAMGACGSREHELEPQMAITSKGPHLLPTSSRQVSPPAYPTALTITSQPGDKQVLNAWSYEKYFRFRSEETMGCSSKYPGPLGLHRNIR